MLTMEKLHNLWPLPRDWGSRVKPRGIVIWTLSYFEQNGYLKILSSAFGRKGRGGLCALWSFLTLNKATKSFDFKPKFIRPSLLQKPFMLTIRNLQNLQPLPQRLGLQPPSIVVWLLDYFEQNCNLNISTGCIWGKGVGWLVPLDHFELI
jgi:hypothetical protein